MTFENERPQEEDFTSRKYFAKALTNWYERRREWMEKHRDSDWLADESQELLKLGRQERYRLRELKRREIETKKQKEIDKF